MKNKNKNILIMLLAGVITVGAVSGLVYSLNRNEETKETFYSLTLEHYKDNVKDNSLSSTQKYLENTLFDLSDYVLDLDGYHFIGHSENSDSLTLKSDLTVKYYYETTLESSFVVTFEYYKDYEIDNSLTTQITKNMDDYVDLNSYKKEIENYTFKNCSHTLGNWIVKSDVVVKYYYESSEIVPETFTLSVYGYWSDAGANGTYDENQYASWTVPNRTTATTVSELDTYLRSASKDDFGVNDKLNVVKSSIDFVNKIAKLYYYDSSTFTIECTGYWSSNGIDGDYLTDMPVYCSVPNRTLDCTISELETYWKSAQKDDFGANDTLNLAKSSIDFENKTATLYFYN